MRGGRVMLPPFHGERMRSYESIVREVAEREIESWPVGSEFALHPRMQAVTLEVILRAVFGVSDPSRARLLRERLPRLLGGAPRLGCSCASCFPRASAAAIRWRS